MGYHFPNQEHREREEIKASAFPVFARLEKAVSAVVRGGAMNGPSQLATKALECTKSRGEGCGREWGEWRAHRVQQ